MTAFTVTPLTPNFGAEVGDIDLSRTPTSDTMQHLERALLKWKVLFFRNQDIDIEDQKRQFPDPEHPVVRRHPQTGNKSLYVNTAFTRRIVGLEQSESDELLAFLYRQAAIPEYQCRFRWRPNSIAFWDNRCTQHYAVADFHPQRRVVERITIGGDRPV